LGAIGRGALGLPGHGAAGRGDLPGTGGGLGGLGTAGVPARGEGEEGSGEDGCGATDHGGSLRIPAGRPHDEAMTSLTATLGTRHPVVCAPMAGVAGGRLAHAVSAAGGLGMIGAGGSATSGWIVEQAALAGAGGTPFGIGLMAWVPELSVQLDAITALEGEVRPALVSVSFGDLAPPVARLREAGLRTACQVGNAEDLEATLAADADVVVARGGEGGGHG